MKTAFLAVLTLAVASCATDPRHREGSRNDFLVTPDAAARSSADRGEYREEHRQERQESVQDFSYRRGTW